MSDGRYRIVLFSVLVYWKGRSEPECRCETVLALRKRRGGVHLSSKLRDVMAADVAFELSDYIECIVLRGAGWAREM